MRLVVEDDAEFFLLWLRQQDYPDLEKNWGVGLLGACYKYFVMTPAKPNRKLAGEDRVGAVWYHWDGADTLVVHLCAVPHLIITRNLIGDFYKVPSLLGAKYLCAHIDSPEVEEFARRAGWGTKPGETTFTTSLPSRWALYDPIIGGFNDGSDIRRRAKRTRHVKTGSADRGGPGKGQRGQDGSRPTSVGSREAETARAWAQPV